MEKSREIHFRCKPELLQKLDQYYPNVSISAAIRKIVWEKIDALDASHGAASMRLVSPEGHPTAAAQKSA